MGIFSAYLEEYNKYLEPIRFGQEQGMNIVGPTFENMQTARTKYKGKETIILSSNNYLGMSGNKEVLEAMKRAIDKYGASVCGSRMNNGTTDLHVELEHKLAEFLNTEDAIICNSGFMANLAAMNGISKDYDSIIISDSLNHSSINEGIKLSNSQKKIFSHNNMEKLEYILNRNRDVKKKLIVVDGVYSMSGDIAPLDKIVNLAQKHDAMVMVDEAHSLGVFGDKGKGICNYFNVQDDVQIKMATFSKSLGNIGGCIAGTKDLCDYLRFVSSPYLFSVALSPASVAGTLKALELIQKESYRIDKLWENTKYFKQLATEIGFTIRDSKSPIIPIVIGDNIETIKFTEELLNSGVYVCSAVFPVVPKDQSIIRVTMSANLEKNDIEEALAIMKKVAEKYKII